MYTPVAFKPTPGHPPSTGPNADFIVRTKSKYRNIILRRNNILLNQMKGDLSAENLSHFVDYIEIPMMIDSQENEDGTLRPLMWCIDGTTMVRVNSLHGRLIVFPLGSIAHLSGNYLRLIGVTESHIIDQESVDFISFKKGKPNDC